ncbi:unnamed protein product [Malus baccata var. baccata]
MDTHNQFVPSASFILRRYGFDIRDLQAQTKPTNLTCSRESYKKGVVVACCGGCNNLHLIADHLGYFGNHPTLSNFWLSMGKR